jgi:hypothetical protein
VPEAKALANALVATVADATSADDFEDRAKALEHDKKLEITVERLEPFVADGRQPQGPGLIPEFVRAAVPLAPGATSGIVPTSFGWHVIRMIERLPEHRVPFEDRRRRFYEEIITLRAHTSLERLEQQLVAKYGVSVSNGVEDLMAEAVMTFLGSAKPSEAPSP